MWCWVCLPSRCGSRMCLRFILRCYESRCFLYIHSKIYVLFKVVDSSGCSTISKIRWSKYTEIERCCHLILKNRARLENRKRSSDEHTTQRYYSATFTPDTRGHKFSQAHGCR